MLMSEKMAADILGSDVGSFAGGVTKELRRNISDAQFSALVSFAYNVGLVAAAWIIRERFLKSKEAGI